MAGATKKYEDQILSLLWDHRATGLTATDIAYRLGIDAGRALALLQRLAAVGEGVAPPSSSEEADGSTRWRTNLTIAPVRRPSNVVELAIAWLTARSGLLTVAGSLLVVGAVVAFAGRDDEGQHAEIASPPGLAIGSSTDSPQSEPYQLTRARLAASRLRAWRRELAEVEAALRTLERAVVAGDCRDGWERGDPCYVTGRLLSEQAVDVERFRLSLRRAELRQIVSAGVAAPDPEFRP